MAGWQNEDEKRTSSIGGDAGFRGDFWLSY
jgi:hypothetical protein